MLDMGKFMHEGEPERINSVESHRQGDHRRGRIKPKRCAVNLGSGQWLQYNKSNAIRG